MAQTCDSHVTIMWYTTWLQTMNVHTTMLIMVTPNKGRLTTMRAKREYAKVQTISVHDVQIKTALFRQWVGLPVKDRLIKGCTWIFHYILWCHATWTHESDWSSPVPFLLPFSPNPDIWEQINIACKLTPFHFIIHITHRQPDMYIIYIFIYILYTHSGRRKGL